MSKPTKKNQSNDAPVDEELKKILKKHEQQELLFSPETLLPQRSRAEQLEKEILYNQKGIPLIDIRVVINDLAVQCPPMFPRSKPFFKLMFKLRGWDHLNPDSFIKPPCVATDIKKYIYARFNAGVLPTLLAKENPITMGYIKKYKLYWFFDNDTLLMLEQVIQQAIDVMKISKDWYDFELKYGKLYKLSVQLKCFTE